MKCSLKMILFLGNDINGFYKFDCFHMKYFVFKVLYMFNFWDFNKINGFLNGCLGWYFVVVFVCFWYVNMDEVMFMKNNKIYKKMNVYKINGIKDST